MSHRTDDFQAAYSAALSHHTVWTWDVMTSQEQARLIYSELSRIDADSRKGTGDPRGAPYPLTRTDARMATH